MAKIGNGERKLTHGEALDKLRPAIVILRKLLDLEPVLEHAITYDAEIGAKERELAKLDEALTKAKARVAEAHNAAAQAEQDHRDALDQMTREAQELRDKTEADHARLVEALGEDLTEAQDHAEAKKKALSDQVMLLEQRVNEVQARLDQLMGLQEEARRALGVG